MNKKTDLPDETRFVKALAALAQVHRLRVFRLLVGAGHDGLHPGQIADSLDVTPNALSFHLKELHHCGLVTQAREGRFLRYRADFEAMRQLMDFLAANCCEGESCGVVPLIDCQSQRYKNNATGSPAIKHLATVKAITKPI